MMAVVSGADFDDLKFSDIDHNALNLDPFLQPQETVYNPDRNEYLVVYSVDDLNEPGIVEDENEIYAQVILRNGFARDAVRISEFGGLGDNEFKASFPSVAWNGERNEYLVVWFGDDNSAAVSAFTVNGSTIVETRSAATIF